MVSPPGAFLPYLLDREVLGPSLFLTALLQFPFLADEREAPWCNPLSPSLGALTELMHSLFAAFAS